MQDKHLEFLEKVGNNPIEEPEIYDSINNGDKWTKTLTVAVEKHGAEDLLDFEKDNPKELAELYNKIKSKVNDFEYEDGTVKSTPKTQEAKMLNILEIEELQDIYKEISKEKDKKRLKKLEERKNKWIFETRGVKEEDFTEWEKMLVAYDTMIHLLNVAKTAMGKQ